MKTIVIFIAGVPGTGKTTLAYQLALSLKIDKIISLDLLKNFTKHYITQEGNPYLYTTTHEAYLVEKLTPVNGFKIHCQTLEDILLPLLNEMCDEHVIIVEGAQLTPEIQKKLNSDKFYSIYINLFSSNSKKLLERYQLKGKMRAYNWADNIEIILLIQDYLLSLTDTNNYSIEQDDLLDSILLFIYKSLEGHDEFLYLQ